MRGLVLLLVLAALPALATDMGGMRAVEPIRGPGEYRETADVAPLREQVEEFVRALAAAWGGAELGHFLAPDFPARERVLDELALQVPLDARLRILSVGMMQLVGQHALPDGSRVSEVLVRVRAQVEFTAADGRLQRLPSDQEWVVRVAQRLP